METKTALITGANTGIGKATATELARQGYALLLSGRNATALQEAATEIQATTGNSQIQTFVADLADMDSVRALADQVIASTQRLDVLVNNAGLAVDEYRTTGDGFETTMAVNFYALVLLTERLLPLLKSSSPSRIVNVSSDAHYSAKAIDPDTLNDESKFHWMGSYANSKAAVVAYTRTLAGELEGTGVTCNALHPGVIRTQFGSGGDLSGLRKWGFALAKLFLRGPAYGARTSVLVATDPKLASTTGEYFSAGKQKYPSRTVQDAELGSALTAHARSAVGC